MLPRCDAPNVPKIQHEGELERPEGCAAPCSADDSCFYAGNQLSYAVF